MANASYQSRIPQKYQQQLSPYVTQAALKYNVPESKIWEQIAVESGGDPNAKSPTGPLGAMQISTAAAKDAGYTKQDMLDPAKNIDAGTRKLKSDLDYYNGDWNKARLAYNQGRGMANKILSGKAEMNKEATNYVNNPIFQAGYISKEGAAAATAQQAVSPQPIPEPLQATGFATASRSRWEAAKGAEGGFNPQYLSNNNPATNTNYWADRAQGLDTGVNTVKDKNSWADAAEQMLGNLQAQQDQQPQFMQHSQRLAQMMQQTANPMFGQVQEAPRYNFNQSLATPTQFQILNNFGGL